MNARCAMVTVHGHEFAALISLCKLDKRLKIDVRNLNLIKGVPSVKFFLKNIHFKFCGILLFKIGDKNYCAMVISQQHVVTKTFPALNWEQYVDFVVTLRQPDGSDADFCKFEAEHNKNNRANPLSRDRYGRFGLLDIMVNGTNQIIFKSTGEYAYFHRRVT